MNKHRMMVAVLAMAGFAAADVTVDFDGLSTTGANTYNLPGVDGTHNWDQQGVQFSRTVSYGGFAWDGMTYSSVNDTTTAGYSNQYAVYGNGQDRSGTGSYAVFFQPFANRNMISLPVATTVKGFYANNTTYAALAMLNGEAPARAFTTASNDWFKLTVEGFDAADSSLGTVEFNLADYAQGSADLISDWTWVDLAGLGNEVKSLKLALSSTDNGDWGMNTPSYFAMDDLVVAAIPEPGTITLMLMASVGMIAFRNRRI